jgi:hypothetical protein
MIQLFFVDLEQKVDWYEFAGNFELVGGVYDVLTGQIELLDEIAVKSSVAPISHFTDSNTDSDDSDIFSLEGQWFAPDEGITTLNAILAWLNGAHHASFGKSAARQLRALNKGVEGRILEDELKSLREYLEMATNSTKSARFKILISEYRIVRAPKVYPR